MQFNPLSHIELIGRTNILTNRIIVKALQRNRGDIIRVMNDADLKMMVESVINAVCNKLTAESQRAYEYKYDPTAGFKPRPDVEIEEEVTAYFEIDGKLQYREVKFESFVDLPGVDKSVNWLTQQMKMGELGMLYNQYSLADRLEKADILTNIEIMKALQDERGERGDVIRAMSYAKFKRWRKDIFSFYYRALYAQAAFNFEWACDEYDAERDGIENDPRKTFGPKTKFEIDQELRAYFEEQDKLR